MVVTTSTIRQPARAELIRWPVVLFRGGDYASQRNTKKDPSSCRWAGRGVPNRWCQLVCCGSCGPVRCFEAITP